jgi:hypothetical protein
VGHIPAAGVSRCAVKTDWRHGRAGMTEKRVVPSDQDTL